MNIVLLNCGRFLGFASPSFFDIVVRRCAQIVWIILGSFIIGVVFDHLKVIDLLIAIACVGFAGVSRLRPTTFKSAKTFDR